MIFCANFYRTIDDHDDDEEVNVGKTPLKKSSNLLIFLYTTHSDNCQNTKLNVFFINIVEWPMKLMVVNLRSFSEISEKIAKL